MTQSILRLSPFFVYNLRHPKMNRRTSMEENTLDFNFWPSFSDLMLTLVLILVIVVFAVIAAFSVGKEEPTPEGTDVPIVVEENQKKLIKSIASAYGVEPLGRENNSFEIRIQLEDGTSSKITIKNELTIQRYSFSDRILFEPDEYNLNEIGKETLLTVGLQIKNNLNNISEIQIQGHADPDPPAYEPSNLHLAAKRAIEVFQFLQRKIGIDPAKHLMSATSFGEYKPVQRLDGDSTYTPEKLKMHHKTRKLKAKNRRMEILLFYRNEQTE